MAPEVGALELMGGEAWADAGAKLLGSWQRELFSAFPLGTVVS